MHLDGIADAAKSVEVPNHHDPEIEIGRISTVLEEEGREIGQATQPRYVQDTSFSGETRTRRAVF